MRTLRYFTLIGGLALLLLLLTGCVLPQVQQGNVEETEPSEPRVQMQPAVREPGSIVFVTGSGWVDEEAVQISLKSSTADSSVSVVVGVAQPDPAGNFTMLFVYPSNSFWRTASNLTVVADTLDESITATTAFIAAPAAAVQQPTPAPASNTADSTNSASDVVGTGRISGAVVNLRQGPSTSYPVQAVGERGTTFDVFGQSENGSWLRIRLTSGEQEGAEGWMARDFTDYTGSAPTLTAPVAPLTGNVPLTVVNWRGEYFANPNLTGIPVLVRNDRSVKFDWGFGSPGAGVPANRFSARWTRNVPLPAGEYRFFVRADDGVRLWIDGEMVLDRWQDEAATTYTVNKAFAAAGDHDIRIEYYEARGRAEVDFYWERVSEFADWRGAYFNNQSLAGQPIVVRNDREINFNWGLSAPANGVPAEGFSARWTRTASFEDGWYRFTTTADDGIRLFIDGNLIVNDWREGSERTSEVNVRLSGGNHALRVEYYQNRGNAVAKLSWQKVDPPAQYPDWRGEYFANRNLEGQPAFVRNDTAPNFNWGQDGPVGLSSNNFSARWTREASFGSGTYRFHIMADDGVRLFINGDNIVDRWIDGGDKNIAIDREMREGLHNVRVEYYENAGDARIQVWWQRLPETPVATPSPTWTPLPPTATPDAAQPTATEPPAAVDPTVEPTAEPTAESTATVEPTAEPTEPAATAEPTVEPTTEPTVEPTAEPTVEPTVEPTAEPTDETLVDPSGTVNETGATLVDGPSVEANALAQLAANDTVALTGRTEDGLWITVTTADGTIGWLDATTITSEVDLTTLPVVQAPQ